MKYTIYHLFLVELSSKVYHKQNHYLGAVPWGIQYFQHNPEDPSNFIYLF